MSVGRWLLRQRADLLLRQQFHRSILFAPKWRPKLQLSLPQFYSLLMSAFADIVRRPDHTLEISLQICEGILRRARSTNFGYTPSRWPNNLEHVCSNHDHATLRY